jgi:hypothetical protein
MPYTWIKENPKHLFLHGLAVYPYLLPSTGTYFLYLSEVSITQKMIDQGYFTLEYGYVTPETGTTPWVNPKLNPLGTLQVPLGGTVSPVASITAMRYKVTVPPSARISAMRYTVGAPTRAAKITAMRYTVGVPTRAAKITAMRYKVRSASIKAMRYVKPPAYAQLTGTVRGIMGMLVGGATVTLNDKTTITAPDGTFQFTDLPLKTYDLTVKHWLYTPYTEKIEILEPKTYTKEITLSPNLYIISLLAGGTIGFISLLGWAVSE